MWKPPALSDLLSSAAAPGYQKSQGFKMPMKFLGPYSYAHGQSYIAHECIYVDLLIKRHAFGIGFSCYRSHPVISSHPRGLCPRCTSTALD